jgi:hypothetical protein
MTTEQKVKAAYEELQSYEDPKPKIAKNTCYPLLIEHILTLFSHRNEPVLSKTIIFSCIEHGYKTDSNHLTNILQYNYSCVFDLDTNPAGEQLVSLAKPSQT